MHLHLAVQHFLEWKSTYAPVAATAYRVHLDRFAAMIHKRTRDLDINDVVGYSKKISVDHSATYMTYTTIVLKNFLGFLYHQNLTKLNPYLVKVPHPIIHSHAAIDHDEFLRMNATVGEDNFSELQKKVSLNLLYYTGVRVSELADLNISDIDFQKSRAMIRTKKNRQYRWIFWPDHMKDMFTKFLGIRLSLNSQPAVFVAPTKSRRDRVSTRTIQRWVKEIALRAGIEKKISPHSFRHGRAHRILEKGGTVKDVQICLGHSEQNPQASFSYLKLDPQEAEKRLRGLF